MKKNIIVINSPPHLKIKNTGSAQSLLGYSVSKLLMSDNIMIPENSITSPMIKKTRIRLSQNFLFGSIFVAIEK